jgi:hypothetical protein
MQVGVAIGALAVIDQYLQYVSVVYDGSDVRFAGRTVKINYCMLSGGVAGSIDSRCNYAFTVAAISLAISALWAIHEVGSSSWWHRPVRWWHSPSCSVPCVSHQYPALYIVQPSNCIHVTERHRCNPC